MAVGLALYAGFAATFASFVVANDGLVYYEFLRRLVGEDVSGAYAFQFGVAYFNLPFYLAGRAVEAAGVSAIFGAPPTQTAIGVASNVALVLTLYLTWRLLRELDLPAGPAVLLLALFGSPLFYYTAFQPSYKHAVDALAVTATAVLLLRLARGASSRLALALGACLAFLVSVRYVNFALVPGFLLPLALARRWDAVRLAVLGLVAAGALIFAIPAARDIPFDRGRGTAVTAATQPAVRAAGLGIPDPCPDAIGYGIDWSQCLRNKLGVHFDFGAPFRMLFSVRRGLFLWTPLTALATVGLALLVARLRERRAFVGGLAGAAVMLVFAHFAWGFFWTNGFSFSQRFLSGLFPIYALGVAELLRRWRGVALAALTLCAAFSLYVGFNHFIGYRAISERDGLGTVLTTGGDRGPVETFRLIAVRALERWGLR